MAYSARTTYGTQKKYSRRGQELDTQIKGLIYKDQAELEKQVQEIVDGWRDAAKGGKWGNLLEALDFVSGFTPWLADDVLTGTMKAANYDKLRSKALKGVDLSKMEYLGQSAKDVDFEIREEGYKALEDLTFGEQMKDVGLDLIFKAAMQSEAMEKFKESWDIKTGPAGEEIVTVETPGIDAGKDIMVSENYYIPADFDAIAKIPDLETISSFEDTAQALKSTEVGEYFKVVDIDGDETFYKHLDPKTNRLIHIVGDENAFLKEKDAFIKEFGTKFEGDIKRTLKEKLKPGEGFLFGKEGQPGYLKTFREEMKDVLFEGPEARTKRAVYDYSKGIGLGDGWDAAAFYRAMTGGAIGGGLYDNKDNE